MCLNIIPYNGAMSVRPRTKTPQDRFFLYLLECKRQPPVSSSACEQVIFVFVACVSVVAIKSAQVVNNIAGLRGGPAYVEPRAHSFAVPPPLVWHGQQAPFKAGGFGSRASIRLSGSPASVFNLLHGTCSLHACTSACMCSCLSQRMACHVACCLPPSSLGVVFQGGSNRCLLQAGRRVCTYMRTTRVCKYFA